MATPPLGSMPSAASLKMLRNAAHGSFDRFWTRSGGRIGVPGVRESASEPGRRRVSPRARKAQLRQWRQRRTRAYVWLAEQLGIPEAQCHFGWFDEATLRRVLELCAGCGPR